MGDSDIYWPISGSWSSSTSWKTGSMDLGYKSNETNPKMILSIPVQVEQEEVEYQTSNELDLIISDDKSIDGDPLDARETDDTGGLQEGSQRGFTYGGLLWDAS